MRCNETLKKNAIYCVRKKTVYSNTPTIDRNHRNKKTTEQKYTEKNVCCFLNFYGRPISTVIILVKNTSISWVCDERLVGLVYFDHAIIWLHFGHWNMFLVPSKCCRWRTKQKKNTIVLCNDFVFFCCCCIFLSISAWSDANPVTYSEFLGFCRFCNWKLMSCSIIEFAVNHRQAHCLAESPEILYFCNIYTTRTHRILFFSRHYFSSFCALCGIWLRCCFAPFTWYLFHCSPSNIWHCHTIRLTRWHTV